MKFSRKAEPLHGWRKGWLTLLSYFVEFGERKGRPRLISTTFPEVVEKGRASILQARLISTTSSESGHAVMYGPESHKHENVDSGPRRLVG